MAIDLGALFIVDSGMSQISLVTYVVALESVLPVASRDTSE